MAASEADFEHDVDYECMVCLDPVLFPEGYEGTGLRCSKCKQVLIHNQCHINPSSGQQITCRCENSSWEWNIVVPAPGLNIVKFEYSDMEFHTGTLQEMVDGNPFFRVQYERIPFEELHYAAVVQLGTLWKITQDELIAKQIKEHLRRMKKWLVRPGRTVYVCQPTNFTDDAHGFRFFEGSVIEVDRATKSNGPTRKCKVYIGDHGPYVYINHYVAVAAAVLQYLRS